jgi:hypothetical protein
VQSRQQQKERKEERRRNLFFFFLFSFLKIENRVRCKPVGPCRGRAGAGIGVSSPLRLGYGSRYGWGTGPVYFVPSTRPGGCNSPFPRTFPMRACEFGSRQKVPAEAGPKCGVAERGHVFRNAKQTRNAGDGSPTAQAGLKERGPAANRRGRLPLSHGRFRFLPSRQFGRAAKVPRKKAPPPSWVGQVRYTRGWLGCGVLRRQLAAKLRRPVHRALCLFISTSPRRLLTAAKSPSEISQCWKSKTPRWRD